MQKIVAINAKNTKYIENEMIFLMKKIKEIAN